jgi:AraC-like DNA-binding protein
MPDPLSEVIQRLRPRAVFSRAIEGAGAWSVRYGAFGQPSFAIVLEGECRLAVDGLAPLQLQAGDFVLMPATPGFTMQSLAPAPPVHLDPNATATSVNEGPLRYGRRRGPPDVRQLGGWFEFAAPDAGLLVSLLPGIVHVRDADRLARLVHLLRDETEATRPGRDLMLARLVDAVLIEALRSTATTPAPPGLLRGLADPRIAVALQQMHARIDHAWTMAELAKHAALSRSQFYERFTASVGVPPMEYLLRWRMSVAKELLRAGELSIEEVAGRIGYASASTFCTAFRRDVDQTPGRYRRAPDSEHEGAA